MDRFGLSGLARLARLASIGAVLCGCEADGTDGLGPTATPATGYHFVMLGGDTLHGHAGDTVSGARVLVLGPNHMPAAGLRVRWQVQRGGGRIDRTMNFTDGSGVATVSWALGANLTSLQALRLQASERDSVLLYARAELPRVVALGADTTLLTIDTVGAPVRTPLHFSVHLPDGRPVVGATVDYAVVRGGGRLSAQVAQTDSAGSTAVSWQLGDTAGAQAVAVSVRPASGQQASARTFRALSVAGAPAQIVAVQDTVRFDALGDSLLPPVVVRDRAGNTCTTIVSWSSLSPGVVSGDDDRGISSLGNGIGQVAARSGTASVVIPVVVAQRPAGLRLGTPVVTLNWIGASARLAASVLDRRGVDISAALPVWDGLAGPVAALDSTGSLQALATGTARAVVRYQGLTDTVSVQVGQVPASISVSPAIDTLGLDSTRTPTVVVADSGGTAIPSPPVQITPTDSSVIGVGPAGALVATLPGTTDLVYGAGTASTTITRVVEGTAMLVGGRRQTTAGTLTAERIEIVNGRIRLVWDPPQLWEAGGVDLDVRIGGAWQPANARHWGDWLYIGYSVMKMPTRIFAVELTTDRIGLTMEFDDHWFAPPGYPAPSDWVGQPYPFTRTVWLRKNDNGYYSWIDLKADLGRLDVEHENGFGGVWGPATIRTSQLTIRTDTLRGTVTYNGNPRTIDLSGARTEAAEFLRDGDPVRRVLVPLPGAPFITPVFPGWGYGSVYVYRGSPNDFGVYMYADVNGAGPSAQVVCASAWANAPFPLPAVSAAELASCGPSGP